MAETLEMRPAAVDSALQRAHRTVDERLPRESQQSTLRAVGDAVMRQIADRFIDAWERADVDSVVAMLARDAALAMPPWPSWYSGREAIAAFLQAVPLAPGASWRMRPTHANGQIAFGHYVWSEPQRAFVAHGICILTLREEEIAAITNFSTPELFRHFALPAMIELAQ